TAGKARVSIYAERRPHCERSQTDVGGCMKIFKLPDLGEGLQDAEIVEWHVKVGDEVAADQPLVSVETAKAVVEIPSPIPGASPDCLAVPVKSFVSGRHWPCSMAQGTTPMPALS